MSNTSGLIPYKPGQSGNTKGRPKGRVSIGQRIRAILEDGDCLPQAVKDTIEIAVGEGKNALDAIIMVGILQALQGDEKWAKLLIEHGWGKPEQVSKIGDLPGENFQTVEVIEVPQSTMEAAIRKVQSEV